MAARRCAQRSLPQNPGDTMRFQAKRHQALRLFCTKLYSHYWRFTINAVRHASTFLGLISKAPRANYDKVADEPIPERWVELIHHLSRGTHLRRRRSLRVGRDARTRQPTTTWRYLGSPTPGRRRGVPVIGKVGHHPAPGALPSYFYPSSSL